MGRRKIINDPYAQEVKRERKKRVTVPKIPTVYDNGLVPGNIVIVTSKTTFSGTAIGVVIDIQKWCEGGIPVASTHETYKNICIRTERGDTIQKVTQ